MKHLCKTEAKHLDACVQFSVAMAFDADVDTVAHELNTWGAVTTAQLRRYLVLKGFSGTGDSTEDVGVVAEGQGLLTIHGHRVGHAVAFKDGKIYDPNGKTFDGVEELCKYYTKHTGDTWKLYAIFEAKPLVTRKWDVGHKIKEEAT